MSPLRPNPAGYEALVSHSRASDASPGSQTWHRLRSRPVLMGLVLLSALGLVALFGGSDGGAGLLRAVGMPGHPIVGPISRHTEPISVVLMAGGNERGILEATRAILSNTVGPYELIGVFTGEDDASELIVSDLVQHHQSAKVDHRGRGLRGYTVFSTSPPPSSPPAELHLSALRSAKHAHVAIVNANDVMQEYGWDRILLTGIKSSQQLLAVSGRAAANIEVDGGRKARMVDGVGEPLPESHYEDASGPVLHIRQVAMRSPILYDARKMRELGYTSADLEAAGMGDLDMCLRGQRDQGWQCAYYPVSFKTKDTWKLVPGTAGFGLELELSAKDIQMLDLASHTFGGGQIGTIRAIRREAQDIPMTIVTAISAPQIPYLQHLYTTLDWSSHTRYIVYLLRSPSHPICLSELADMPGLEFRRLDTTRRHPAWMHIDKEMGQYAWKLELIREVIADYGGLVFWLDPQRRLVSEMRRTWSEVARLGIWSTSSGGPLNLWTHPGMLAHFNLPESTWTGTNCDASNMGFNSQNAAAMTKVIRPLLDCARDKDCIAPPGSSRSNHRQDQAALTALIHLHGYSCELRGPIEIQREKQTHLDVGKCLGEVY